MAGYFAVMLNMGCMDRPGEEVLEELAWLMHLLIMMTDGMQKMQLSLKMAVK